jgi:hypothetical protein
LLLAPLRAQYFTDVPVLDPDHAMIEDTASCQLMEGYPDGLFRPESPMPYADGIMLQARLLNIALRGFMILPAAATPGRPIPSLPSTHWAYPAARFLADHGLLDLQRAQPLEAPMTRGMLLTALSRLLHAGVAAPLPEALREFADNSLLPDGWQAQPERPVTRRETAGLVDKLLFYLTQHAVTEGTVTRFETDKDGTRWVHLDTPIGAARLCMPVRGVIVHGGDADSIGVETKIRTLSDAVSGMRGAPYYRVREATIQAGGQVSREATPGSPVVR